MITPKFLYTGYIMYMKEESEDGSILNIKVMYIGGICRLKFDINS